MLKDKAGDYMLKDYFVGIGMDILKDTTISAVQLRELRKRLEEYVARQNRINYHCTKEEELDFAGLAKYISNDLCEDVKMRLFGNIKERRMARATIISKAEEYSKAKTSLSVKRACKFTEGAVDILRSFYKKKVNRELALMAAQIEEDVIESITEEMKHQTKKIIDGMDKISMMSIERNMELMRQGDYAQVEKSLSNWFDAIGCTHRLSPYYRLEWDSQDKRFYSMPLTPEAIQKYPSRIACTGTIEMAGKYISKISSDTIDYANRHQVSIMLNVKTAQKFLGNEIDPIQHEAEDLIGESITIPPKPFPPASPCSIAIDENVIFDYVLLRVEEILDDGTYVLSNTEQSDFFFKIRMKMNIQTGKTTFDTRLENPSNRELLRYLRFMKSASVGATITIKALAVGEQLAKGYLNGVKYKSDFESIDDEIDLLEKIVRLEEYFNERIEIPEEILLADFNAISYLAKLIRGDECKGKWDKLELSLKLTDELRSKICMMDEEPFSLSYVSEVKVTIFGKVYEVSAVKIFESVRIADLKRLKKKAEVLDVEDSIKMCYLPGDGDSGVWSDVMYTGKE